VERLKKKKDTKMERITNKDIECLVEYLNDTLKRPKTPYKAKRDSENRLVANAGHFMTSSACGRIGLDMMCKGGGSTHVLHKGTKRELYDQMHAMLKGIREARS
jgi:hypothetical protein